MEYVQTWSYTELHEALKSKLNFACVLCYEVLCYAVRYINVYFSCVIIAYYV